MAALDHARAWQRGATLHPRSRVVIKSARPGRRRSGREELIPRPRSGVAAKRSNPMSKEWQLRGCRRAKRSYSMFKVRRGDLVQGKEQWLCFAGAAVKRYPTSKVRETLVRR